jgi:hypothetical protein
MFLGIDLPEPEPEPASQSETLSTEETKDQARRNYAKQVCPAVFGG